MYSVPALTLIVPMEMPCAVQTLANNTSFYHDPKTVDLNSKV